MASVGIAMEIVTAAMSFVDTEMKVDAVAMTVLCSEMESVTTEIKYSVPEMEF